jgi:hypothetical protein
MLMILMLMFGKGLDAAAPKAASMFREACGIDKNDGLMRNHKCGKH